MLHIFLVSQYLGSQRFAKSGCMDTMMAVPAAAVSGVGSIVGGIWSAVTSIF